MDHLLQNIYTIPYQEETWIPLRTRNREKDVPAGPNVIRTEKKRSTTSDDYLQQIEIKHTKHIVLHVKSESEEQ